MLEPDRMIAEHAIARLAWLRAAALRANAGVVGLATLLVGVAAAASAEGEVLLAGLAGLVAGTLALAMGEYSIAAARAQALAETGRSAPDLDDPVVHHRRGPAHDLLAAAPGGLADYHGVSPLQVAATSGATFALGAALPVAAASAFRLALMPLGIATVSLVGVSLLSALGCRSAGLAPSHCVARTATWTAAALAAAFAIGRVVGPAIV